MAPDRRISPEEADSILRRAASAELPAALPAGEGLTLDELVLAATEAGLDPAVVRRAAALEPTRRAGVGAKLLGGPDRQGVRASLPGTRLPADREALARLCSVLLGPDGKVIRSDEGAFEWRGGRLGGQAIVTLGTTEHGTELEVRAERGPQYLGMWLGGLLGWAALAGLTPLGALGPFVYVGSFFAIPIALARPFWRRASRRAGERLERAALELARVLEDDGDA